MIVGVGIDVVDVARFLVTLERAPRLVEKLFTPEERDVPPTSLAARFAAKEAMAAWRMAERSFERPVKWASAPPTRSAATSARSAPTTTNHPTTVATAGVRASPRAYSARLSSATRP